MNGSNGSVDMVLEQMAIAYNQRLLVRYGGTGAQNVEVLGNL
jgi:hypothetical protein